MERILEETLSLFGMSGAIGSDVAFGDMNRIVFWHGVIVAGERP
jgi:hypothetical protein